MLAQCVANKLEHITGSSVNALLPKSSFGADSRIPFLTIGSFYVVYGVEILKGGISLFIADDTFSGTRYPLAYPTAFFNIVDSRVSRCWHVGPPHQDPQASATVFAFEEWLASRSFYERLVDGEEKEWRTFRSYKEFMDLEFPNPAITDAADLLEDDWHMCPRCSCGWKSKSRLGLLRCPHCESALNNPQYEETFQP